ncbi:hypothetical protein SAMN05216490_4790 [Mucilaginibacter mallensis]|uniref:YD repeat-containing protein n=1 Tax=Mucilaginibacter mallensis TaxID=652787 RepID=A0A1H2CA33_MUCMA|nr:hypothetical protein [Mucilaginibacter mallensis]SDT67415.1 hypothetical protein SAMN05216490_4790 [Mucilaginibacter mallensis]
MKRSILYPIACIIVNLVVLSAAKAQIPLPPVNLQSPNAANLGLYGEYPVSFFTGVPQIEIPLYTLKEREISVPISLSYHASGFRPDQHPGWVGLGWSLNAGGVITRVVNDIPDEQNTVINPNASPLNSSTCPYAGYFFYNDEGNADDNRPLMNSTSWNSQTNVFNIANETCYLSGINNEPVQSDSQPDEFSFNFPGYNGKFYLQADGTWYISCDRPVTITPLSVIKSQLMNVPFKTPTSSLVAQWGYSQSISGFCITTDDGTQYIFGKNPSLPVTDTAGMASAIEYGVDYFNQNNAQWVANSWYLTQIISKNQNEKVTFTYTPDSYINQLAISVNFNYGTKTYVSGAFNANACQSTSFSSNIYSGQLIRPTYLTSISTSNFNIQFNRCNTTELFVAKSVYDNTGFATSGSSSGTTIPRLPFLNSGNFDSSNCSTGIGAQSVQASNVHTNAVPGGSDNYTSVWNDLFWKQLNNISIYNGPISGTPIKQFNFSYSSDPTVRLTLNSLIEVGQDGTAKPPYQFYYNGTPSGTVPPGYLAWQTDHWGFWNNTSALINYVSNIPDTTGYFNWRQPNSNAGYAATSMLNEIKYPTGGITQFSYELNKYSKSVASNRTQLATYTSDYIAGGVRIKSIISSDPVNAAATPFEKDYYYVTNYDNNYLTAPANYLSSGNLGGQGQYTFGSYYVVSGTANNGITYISNLFSSQSVLPVSNNSMGSHIGYSEVTERRSDGSYTKYLYTNFDHANDAGHLDEAPLTTLSQTQTNYQPYISLEEERGKILKETVYNSTGHPVKSTAFTYTALNKGNSLVKSIKARSFTVCPPGTASSVAYACEGSAYGYYTYSYLPVSKTTTIYDVSGNNPVTTSETYAYDNPLHRQITRSYLTDSKGETLVNVNIYPQDYANPTGFVQQMIAINNVGSPIEKVTLRSTTGASPTLNVTSGSVTEYPVATGDYPSTSYTLDLANPLPLATTGSTTNFVLSNVRSVPLLATTAMSTAGSYARDSHYRAAASFDYDHEKLKDFNIYTTQTVANLSTVFLWDVSRRYPVAEVKNANSSKIAFSSFEEAETPGATRLNNPNNWNIPAGVMNNTITARTGQYCGYITGATISTVDPIPIGTYTVSYWSKAGPATISGGTVQSTKIGPTSPTGWTYYEHTMQLSSAANVSVAGNASAQYIDDLRLYPIGALMTSYTYSPLVGMTSATDAKNETTFYEYDSFQRLLNIKDKDGSIVKHMTYHYQGQ